MSEEVLKQCCVCRVIKQTRLYGPDDKEICLQCAFLPEYSKKALADHCQSMGRKLGIDPVVTIQRGKASDD